jgi:hypothetical protein
MMNSVQEKGGEQLLVHLHLSIQLTQQLGSTGIKEEINNRVGGAGIIVPKKEIDLSYGSVKQLRIRLAEINLLATTILTTKARPISEGAASVSTISAASARG